MGSGVVEAAIERVLRAASTRRAGGAQVSVRCSFLEVVGDRVQDLLAAQPGPIVIRDHRDELDPQVLGCEEVRVVCGAVPA